MRLKKVSDLQVGDFIINYGRIAKIIKHPFIYGCISFYFEGDENESYAFQEDFYVNIQNPETI